MGTRSAEGERPRSPGWRSSRLVRNTGWGMAGQVTNSLAAAGSLILLWTVLEPTEFGRFASTTALMMLLGPFTSSGAGHLFIKRVNTDAGVRPAELARAWIQTVVGGVLAACVILALRDLILPQATMMLLTLAALSELIFNRLVGTCKQASQGVEQLWMSASISVVSGATRLVAATMFVASDVERTAESWAVFYTVGVAATMLFATVLLRAKVGVGPFRWPRFEDYREGLSFSASTGATFLKNDADKYLLLRFDFAAAAGVYAAAYRLVGFSLVPVNALISASYARFFREGAMGATKAKELASRLSLIGSVYGVAAGLGCFLLADLIPAVVGDEWEEAADALRWMSPLPLLVSLQWFGGNALTGAGQHSTRVRILVAGSTANVLMNVALIPRFEWRGAMASTLATDAFIVIALWVFLQRSAESEATSMVSEVPSAN